MNPTIVGIANQLLECQIPKPDAYSSDAGKEEPRIIKTDKGKFPADLNRLRGNLVLEASVGDPLVVILEVGSPENTVIIAACDDSDFYGIWHNGQWLPQTSDHLYGSSFSQLIQSLLIGTVWVATFAHREPLMAICPVSPIDAPAAAPVVAKKKTVIRKRPLATPVIVAEETPAAPAKKPAVVEDQVDLE